MKLTGSIDKNPKGKKISPVGSGSRSKKKSTAVKGIGEIPNNQDQMGEKEVANEVAISKMPTEVLQDLDVNLDHLDVALKSFHVCYEFLNGTLGPQVLKAKTSVGLALQNRTETP